MKIRTDSERVRHSRKMVLEFLASSVDISTAPDAQRYCERYGADPSRYGGAAATVAQPVKIDNALYVRDYSKCILCYKCVEACGTDAQNTFAIAVAGRGFDAHISTEYDVPLPDSACVYCGNCIGVCPTGALMFSSEHELRERGEWDESEQTATDTICSYCGVGCTLTLHVQDNEIVKVTSPIENARDERPSVHQRSLRLQLRPEPPGRGRVMETTRPGRSVEAAVLALEGESRTRKTDVVGDRGAARAAVS